MWPLLKKDGLGLQYLAMLLLWNRLIGHNPFKLQRGSFVELVSSVCSASCNTPRFAHSLQLNTGRIHSNSRSPLARAPSSTTSSLPRSLPSAQRSSEHPRVRTHLALEHQTLCGSELGNERIAWQTREDARKGVWVDACYTVEIDVWA